MQAQGSITIRRRPKDGNPGADAVLYWLVPSATQIKKTDDGKFYPSTITCEKRMKSGNSIPIASTEGTLKYQIGYSDNSVSSAANYTSAITVPANCQWIKFVWYINSIEVATETVSVVEDGDDVLLLDLDNEMQGIPCNSSGTPTGSGTLASTNSTVYKGASVDTGWTFSKTDTNCTSSIDTNGTVSVTAISADKASVKITATKGSKTLNAVMSLYKVKAGATGSSPVVYSLEVSASSISRDSNGTLNPTSINAYKLKTVGNSTERTKEMVLKYQREGQDTSETTLADEGGEIKDMNASCTAVIVTLYDGSSNVLDKERIPIVKDGTNGSDAYYLDLDNEVEGIPCNSSGTPTGSGTLASTNATVYKGASIDSGWTFSKTDTNCTSSIDANGTVSVNDISADKASVKVTATKGSTTLSATMSLYKVKPGSNGTSPVVYSIETSVSAIGRNVAGTLNPSSFTAYKRKTVGATTERTKEKILKYRRMGQDTSYTTLANEGGTIEGMSAACTAVQVVLYDTNGTTELDVETIPIVKDGQKGKDGEDAIRYWLAPSATSVVKSKTGSYSPTGISCNVMYQIGNEDADITTDLFVRYKFNFASGLIQFWKKYNYETSIGIPTGARNLVLELYNSQETSITSDAVGSGACLDSITIPIIFDGSDGGQGKQGIQGCVYRQTEWMEGVEYHNDSELTTDEIRYIDIVLTKDKTAPTGYKAFICRLTHTSDESNNPQKEFADLGMNAGSETKHWKGSDTRVPIYTPFILAEGGLITLMQSNQILIENDEGVITAGISGSLGGNNIRFWAGASSPDNAPFRVDKDGNIEASKATISGHIKTSILDLKLSSASEGAIPNGSLCFDTSSIKLPALSTGYVRSIKVYNPLRSRTSPESLTLIPEKDNVKISTNRTFDMATSETKTLSEFGKNGNVYLELLGITIGTDTIWTVNNLASPN